MHGRISLICCRSLVSATAIIVEPWSNVQEGQILSRCRKCIPAMCEASFRAEKLLESFGKELNCNVCLYLMDQPRKLPCHHAFCRECIETALQHNGCCPVCKQVTQAGLNAVAKHVLSCRKPPNALLKWTQWLNASSKTTEFWTQVRMTRTANPRRCTYLHDTPLRVGRSCSQATPLRLSHLQAKLTKNLRYYYHIHWNKRQWICKCCVVFVCVC